MALDQEHIYARNLEVPSGGGVGTARAIAHAYSVFATGGKELALRPATLRALAAPPVPPERGFYDECLKGDIRFALGFMKPSPGWPFGGLRLSVRRAPVARLAMPTRTRASPMPMYATGWASRSGDPRDLALRAALARSLQVATV